MNARRIGLGIVAIGATLLMSACAAGQHAMTSEEIAGIDGQTADVGQIALRDIVIAPPTGGSYGIGTDAPLTFVVVNNGTTDDQLRSISSTAFSSVTQTSIAVQSGQAVQVGMSASGPTALLRGLTAEAAGEDKGLFPGESIPVTFTFQRAGSVTTQVPVALSQDGLRATVTAPAGADSGE